MVIKRQTVVFDSDHIYQGSPNDCKFLLKNQVNCSGYYIKSIQLQHSYYNINNFNNSFVFVNHSGTTKTITLQPGSYTNTLLATTLQNAMNIFAGDGETYAVSLSSGTGYFTISATDTFGITWNSSSKTQNLAKILGYNDVATSSTNFASFNTILTTNLSGSSSYTAGNISGLTRERAIYITSNLADNSAAQIANFGVYPVLKSLYSQADFMDTVVYDDSAPTVVEFIARTLTEISFKLYDSNLQPLETNGGFFSFEIVLLIEE